MAKSRITYMTTPQQHKLHSNGIPKELILDAAVRGAEAETGCTPCCPDLFLSISIVCNPFSI
jgi:hypothetical protein